MTLSHGMTFLTDQLRGLVGDSKCFQPGFSWTWCFLAILDYPKPEFFQPMYLDILKNLEFLLHSNVSNSDNTGVAGCQIWPN